MDRHITIYSIKEIEYVCTSVYLKDFKRFGMVCNTVHVMDAQIEHYLAVSAFFWLRSLHH